MTPRTRNIGIATAGMACVMIGGLTGLPFPFMIDFIVSAGLATLTGVGLVLALPYGKPESKEPVFEAEAMAKAGAAGVSTKEVVDAITLGTTKLAKIRAAALQIRAPNTQRRIKKICEIGDKIIEDFRVDPKDVRLARSWLNTYLDQTLDIVTKYAQLSRTGARNLEAQKIMTSCEETLDLIEEKFAELLDKLLHNDVMDLDVDITVIKNMLKQEGI